MATLRNADCHRHQLGVRRPDFWPGPLLMGSSNMRAQSTGRSAGRKILCSRDQTRRASCLQGCCGILGRWKILVWFRVCLPVSARARLLLSDRTAGCWQCSTGRSRRWIVFAWQKRADGESRRYTIQSEGETMSPWEPFRGLNTNEFGTLRGLAWWFTVIESDLSPNRSPLTVALRKF